jgi:hypothetical protein
LDLPGFLGQSELLKALSLLHSDKAARIGAFSGPHLTESWTCFAAHLKKYIKIWNKNVLTLHAILCLHHLLETSFVFPASKSEEIVAWLDIRVY